MYLRFGGKLSNALLLAAAVLSAAAGLAQSTGTLRGQVTDPSGAIITGASVEIAIADHPTGAASLSAQTSENGSYIFSNIPEGSYNLRVTASGFALFRRASLTLTGGRVTTLDVRLSLATARQEITVADSSSVEVEPAKNASATILQGKDLDVLSDDPDDLQNDLQALAGPSMGPDGGQIFVDGFSNGELPAKNSIREVRLNSNPFSSEFDKLGLVHIDILTKPGTDKLHGADFIQLDTSALDARDPFGVTKASFLSRLYEGNISGAPSPKTSLFLDYTYRRQDEQALVNATVLNAAFQPAPAIQNVPAPNTRTGISPRFDYQITPNLTLQTRYALARYGNDNLGVGQFNLPIAGTNTRSYNHQAQATATWVVNNSTINETRFQYYRSDNTTAGLNQAPQISVAGAFNGGGASTGVAFLHQQTFELQNNTTMTHGTHLIRFGVRVRGNREDTGTDLNFNGTFNFASITSYAATLSGLADHLSWPQIIANGGGAYQYIVTTGMPQTSANIVDAAPFFQDDWRVRPNLTVSLGARYELQTHVADHADLTPRLGIAWGFGGTTGAQGSTTPKMVLRAGFGTFYDRFAIAQVVNAARLNGSTQQKYVIANPMFYLGGVPPLSELAVGQPVTSYRIDPGLVAPRAYQSMVTLERQWPKNISTSLSYVIARGVHELRTRNINAPEPGTYVFGDPQSGIYPFGNANPVDLYESNGLYKQSQLVFNVNARVNSRFSMFGFYMYARASDDTDGVNTFPANSYDLTDEWSRSLYEVRNRFFIGGNIEAPLGIRFAPAIYYYSPMPYNITIGEDLNGDGQSNDRPSYATPADNPAYVVQTPYGALNLRPLPDETIIPRNLGTGFGSFTVNLRTSRTWGFGEPSGATGTGGSKRYNVTLSVEARNLLNNVNRGTPVGVLTSPMFGEAQGISAVGFGTPTQTANRRLQLQLRFAF
jgi:hypothetical protein